MISNITEFDYEQIPGLRFNQPAAIRTNLSWLMKWGKNYRNSPRQFDAFDWVSHLFFAFSFCKYHSECAFCTTPCPKCHVNSKSVFNQSTKWNECAEFTVRHISVFKLSIFSSVTPMRIWCSTPTRKKYDYKMLISSVKILKIMFNRGLRKTACIELQVMLYVKVSTF